jgi:hydrogenase expression/formation protein HypC
MCLGIPGKVTQIYSEHDTPMGKVDFGGVFKRVCLAHTPHVQVGQFVIVHVGFALETIDEQEAQQIFAFLERMDELGELKQESDPPEDAASSSNGAYGLSTRGLS